jgi:hypothetical protein
MKKLMQFLNSDEFELYANMAFIGAPIILLVLTLIVSDFSGKSV